MRSFSEIKPNSEIPALFTSMSISPSIFTYDIIKFNIILYFSKSNVYTILDDFFYVVLVSNIAFEDFYVFKS